MPELSFDDLVPGGKAGSSDISFDDLIPKGTGEDVSAGMALSGVPILGAYIPQAEAAIRAAAHPLTGVGEKGATWGERYTANLPIQKATYAQAERESPIASTALKMGGGAAALAPLGATALGARALGAAGPMAARIPLGAASGAGISAADALARGEDVGTAAGIGGTVGGALPIVGGAVRRAITPFTARDPGRAGMVAALEREGVQPTAGQQTGSKALQYTENMLGDTPLAGGQATAATERSGQDFTRAALRRIGLQGNDITPAAVDRAVTNIENEFQRLSASTTINFDRQMANDLGAAMNRYGRKLPSQQREVVNDIVNDIVAHGRSMPGDVYQMARSDLSRMAQATRRTDPAYSDALRGLRNALDGAMQRSLTPAERSAWEQARRQWGNWRTLENAVKNTDASGNVRITPAQLVQSAATRERGGFGRGLGDFNELARAGKSLLQPLPNSGTAQRLFASGLGGMVMAPAGIPAAAAGLALPAIGGRAIMSRPAQAYLRNQLLPGRGTGRTGIQAGLMGMLQGYAEGGRPPKGQPIVVGEKGPEVFVPDREGTVIPADVQRYLRATTQDYPKFGAGGIPVNAEAFTSALQGMPESSNIEDRRDELGGFAAAAARTGRRGRQEGAGTRFVEGGYGIPAAIGSLNEGARRAFESAGSLQRGGSYDPAPVVAQALGAVGAPIVAPAMEGAVLGAGAIRRAAIPQTAKQGMQAPAVRNPDAPLFDYSQLRNVPDVPQQNLQRYEAPRGVPERTQALADKANVERVNEVVKRGAEQGGIEWYNTDPLRQAFIEARGQEGEAAYRQYLDMVAATSPRSKVGENSRNAAYYYGLAQRGEPLPTMTKVGKQWQMDAPLPSPHGHIAQILHAQNAGKVLSERGWPVLQNPKPASFVENLAGNQMPVTVDTHNARLWGMTDTKGRPVDKPAKTEYGFIERLQQDEAKKLGMTPAQYQASAWIGGGEQTGLKSSADPFLKVLEDRIRLTAQKTGETPQDVLKRFIMGQNAPGRAGPLLSLAGMAGGAEALREANRRD